MSEHEKLRLLSRDFPVLLLPLRLETRFIDDHLCIRVFPDDIAVQTLQRRLTENEFGYGVKFLETLGHTSCVDEREALWRGLSSQFGEKRALWILWSLSKTEYESNQRESDVNDSPTLALLPSKYVAFLFRDGEFLKEVSGKLIDPELTLTKWSQESPNSNEFEYRSKWLVDLNEAYDCGMAIRVELNDEDKALGFSKIIVIGVRENASAEENVVDLTALLEDHFFSSGMFFPPLGTPTNNTHDRRSGFQRGVVPNEAVRKILNNSDAVSLSPRSNGSLLSAALGISDSDGIVSLIGDSFDEQSTRSRAMRTALWPVTGGYYLEHLVGSDVLSPELRSYIKWHFREFVEAEGPLPALSIGKTPYGLLPVTRVRSALNGGWQPSILDSELGDKPSISVQPSDLNRAVVYDNHIHQFLVKLFVRWHAISSKPELVPHIQTDSEDPDRDLLGVLSMSPHSLSYKLRPFVCERFIAWMISALRNRLFEHDTLGGSGASSEFDWHSNPMEWVYKWNQVWAETKQENRYLLADLAGCSPAQLEDIPLFKMLCWWSGEQDPFPLVISTNPDSGIPQEYLASIAAGESPIIHTLLGELISRSLTVSSKIPEEKQSVLSAISHLASADKGVDFESLLCRSLDLFTNRVDAWVSSFASKRLRAMRKRCPIGIHVGAFGWLEDLVPDKTVEVPRFIHASSTAQAATASILHNAYLSHSKAYNDSGTNPYCVNLSSERVNEGLQLIQGQREGQQIGALLGYKFERWLNEHHRILSQGEVLAQYIEDFRNEFMFDVQTEGVEEAIDAIAPRDTIDGKKLARRWISLRRYNADPDVSQLVGSLSGVQKSIRNQLKIYCDRLVEVLDCVEDIYIHEAVFHVVKGNYDRAASALDAKSGKHKPSRMESFSTGSNTSTFSQIVALIFAENDEGSTSISETRSIREFAEPMIAKWFSEILSNHELVYCQIEVRIPQLNLNKCDDSDIRELPFLSSDEAEAIIEIRQKKSKLVSLDILMSAEYSFAQDTLHKLSYWTSLNDEITYCLPIDINKASADQLRLIAGIDNDIAQSVIDSAPYESLSDLLKIDGIDNIDGLAGYAVVGPITVNLKALEITSIDFLYLSIPEPAGEEAILDRLIRYRVRESFSLTNNSIVNIQYQTKGSGDHSFEDAVLLARKHFSGLKGASHLSPEHLGVQPDENGSCFNQEDIDELKTRCDKVCILLSSILTDLEHDDVDVQIDALIKAGVLGIRSAIPDSRTDEILKHRIKIIKEAVNDRIAKYKKRIDNEECANPDIKIEKYLAAMKDLLGNDFLVLPTFRLQRASVIGTAITDPNRKLAWARIKQWLEKTSQVYDTLQDIDLSITLAEIWLRDEIDIEQIIDLIAFHSVGNPNDWLGDSEDAVELLRDIHAQGLDPVSFVLISQPWLITNLSTSDSIRVAGVFLDKWEEHLPEPEIDTSVALRIDAPNSQPPNCILLAVPPVFDEDDIGLWTRKELMEIVADTFDLVKIRSVDLDAMQLREDHEVDDSDTGAFIPALFIPTDSNKPGWSRDGVPNTIDDWLEMLVTQKEVKLEGILDFPMFTSASDKRSRTYLLEAIPDGNDEKLFPSGLGPVLNGARIIIEGNLLEEREKIFVNTYSILKYPDGFERVELTGVPVFEDFGGVKILIMRDPNKGTFFLKGPQTDELTVNQYMPLSGSTKTIAGRQLLYIDK